MSIPAMTTYVALLRGVNVGGKNKLPMKDLAAIFVEAGCADVRSYIQSGNVVFRASPREATTLPGWISDKVAERFGHRPPVMLRTLEQVEAVLRNNPFLHGGVDENALHVVFLADLPGPERVAGLDPNRSAPDAFVVRGQEIYLHLPNGVADSKLTNAYFDSKLGTISTGRNWRTVNKLADLLRSLAGPG
jgi:uncharacterized protein (DUF1697 family)